MAPRNVEMKILKMLHTTVEEMLNNTSGSPVLDVTSAFLNEWFYNGNSIESIQEIYEANPTQVIGHVLGMTLAYSTTDESRRNRAWLRKRGLAMACERGVHGDEWGDTNYEYESGALKLLIDKGWGGRGSDLMKKIASFL